MRVNVEKLEIQENERGVIESGGRMDDKPELLSHDQYNPE